MPQGNETTVSADEVLIHKSYMQASKEAGLIAGSAIMGASLLGKVSKKLRFLGPTVLFLVTFRNDLDTIVRMAKAYFDGSYKKIPTATIIKLIATLLYFLSPIDLIPDFIPFIGFMDDAVLVSWTMNSFQKDIDAFKEWEGGTQVISI